MRGSEFCLSVPAVLSLEVKNCKHALGLPCPVWLSGSMVFSRASVQGSEFVCSLVGVVLEVSSFQATFFLMCRVKASEQSTEHVEELCAGQGDLVSPSLPVSAAL